MTKFPDLVKCNIFCRDRPDLWPHLTREEAFHILHEEEAARLRADAHEADEDAKNIAEILEQSLREEELIDRARNPEFSPLRNGRNPYDESPEDEDEDNDLDCPELSKEVFHG